VLYPSVYRAHVVPKGYLRSFAVDGKIAVRKGGPSAAVEIKPLEKAGTRPRFYRRTRPKTGAAIDDIEWSLSHIEDKAPPILRTIDELWPLDAENKAVLAELFGYQLVRGQRWFEWHDRHVQERLAEYQQLLEIQHEELESTKRHLTSETYRMAKMLDLGVRLASILGCMHWSLIDFAKPLLATSDHPVDVWPANEGSRTPQASANAGIVNSLEVRVPLSPTTGLLMTWLDANDAATPRLRGTRQHAASLNAFTVANSDREWFHLPETSPPIASGGRLLPLSPELVRGYSAGAVVQSKRRGKAADWLESTKGQTLKVREKLVIT
jgi:hypothetical protein